MDYKNHQKFHKKCYIQKNIFYVITHEETIKKTSKYKLRVVLGLAGMTQMHDSVQYAVLGRKQRLVLPYRYDMARRTSRT